MMDQYDLSDLEKIRDGLQLILSSYREAEEQLAETYPQEIFAVDEMLAVIDEQILTTQGGIK